MDFSALWAQGQKQRRTEPQHSTQYPNTQYIICQSSLAYYPSSSPGLTPGLHSRAVRTSGGEDECITIKEGAPLFEHTDIL